MKKDRLKVIKNIVGIMSILLLIIFFLLVILIKENKLIKSINEFIEKDIKVIYVSNTNLYSKYPIELFEKYDVNYYFVSSDNLSIIEQTKLKNVLKQKDLLNKICIFNDGNVIECINYNNDESLNKFLRKYNLIPDIIGENEGIKAHVKQLINTKYTLIYLPYQMNDEVTNKDLLLKDICKQYDINYERVNAYLLSEIQKNELNSLLNISYVEKEIIILIYNNKVVDNIRNIGNKREVIDNLIELRFINNSENYLNLVSYEEFSDLLLSNGKEIISIIKDDCKYCSDVISVLNDIAVNYDISINYINIEKLDSDVFENVEKKLIELNYEGSFSIPITIIVENGNLLDYVIGYSNIDYFVDIFTENGIIKKEVR